MKTPRCTKCKWFRRSKAKVRIYDYVNGIRMPANSFIKVIEWLNDQACLGWLEDVEVEKVVEQFKKDFGL